MNPFQSNEGTQVFVDSRLIVGASDFFLKKHSENFDFIISKYMENFPLINVIYGLIYF